MFDISLSCIDPPLPSPPLLHHPSSGHFADIDAWRFEFTHLLRNNNDPKFPEKFPIEYRFEEVQTIQVEVYDRRNDSENLSQQVRWLRVVSRCDECLFVVLTSARAWVRMQRIVVAHNELFMIVFYQGIVLLANMLCLTVGTGTSMRDVFAVISDWAWPNVRKGACGKPRLRVSQDYPQITCFSKIKLLANINHPQR